MDLSNNPSATRLVVKQKRFNYPSGYPPGYPKEYLNYPPPPGKKPTGSESGEVVEEVNPNLKAFEDKNVRRAFIKKVYLILTCQVLVSVGIISFLSFSQSVKVWVGNHPGVVWIALAFSVVTLIVIICCGNIRRITPVNYICLGVFTIAEAFLCGLSASSYDEEAVFWAFLITFLVTVGLTGFAFQTKYDFTVIGGVLCVSTLVLIVLALVCVVFPSRLLTLIYAAVGALMFCVYLIYDTQMMIGGKHKYALSPEEYVFAALNLYIDIIMIFLYILELIGLSRD